MEWSAPRSTLRIARRSARVERLLCEYAGDDAGLLARPLTALLFEDSYDRALALRLEAVARDSAVRWPLRRVAALLFETTLFRLTDEDERSFWLDRFALHDPAEMAREGYAAGEPLTAQVWRRIGRMRRFHRLAHTGASDRAVLDYLHAADRECRLTFARYLFSAEDVIARIERHVRRSNGHPDPARHGQFTPESQRTREGLPALERAIVEHLGKDAVIRWASFGTPQSINSLVEQPIGTVVLTVKPPGSCHEIEIKRAGRIRVRPLDVVWARNNYVVPSSHHLDGGAMHHLLAFEAENSAFLSRVFRDVHGFDMEMSRTVYLSKLFGVATWKKKYDLLAYFTDPQVFGPDYPNMRLRMQNVCRTLASHGKEKWFKPKNDLMLTADFIARIKPGQCIQIGTTSFRLDRIERYLGAKGAHRYFREGLKVQQYSPDDARRFADEILDEVLGEYEPPNVVWRSHAQYVEAAFAVPANRARANRNYIAIAEQIGRFWGTLLATRGHTQGESFVARNVGLRSVWANGQWQIRASFMDHDALSFASVGRNNYRPRHSIRNQAKDAKYILGGCFNGKNKVRGEFSFLRTIYRVGPTVERRGLHAFRAAMMDAYHRTHEAMRRPLALTAFRPVFLERLRDWDDLVRSYLATPQIRSARTAWKKASRAMLLEKGYVPKIADEHVLAVTEQAKFLRRVAFLFTGGRGEAADRPQRPALPAAPPGGRRPARAARTGRVGGGRAPVPARTARARSARAPLG